MLPDIIRAFVKSRNIPILLQVTISFVYKVSYDLWLDLRAVLHASPRWKALFPQETFRSPDKCALIYSVLPASALPLSALLSNGNTVTKTWRAVYIDDDTSVASLCTTRSD